MAYISLHSALCKYNQTAPSYSQEQTHFHQPKLLTVSSHQSAKGYADFLSVEFELLALKAAGSAEASQLQQSFTITLPQPQTDYTGSTTCCFKETVNLEWKQSESGSQSRQCSAQDRLGSSASLHISRLCSLRKTSMAAVITFRLQSSTTALEIRSLLKFYFKLSIRNNKFYQNVKNRIL